MGLALAALCVTQITSWGVLYYAFPVLAGAITAATGWSTSAATAAFSTGLVVAAVVGVPVGRWLDRHGPRWVMTIGSVVAVLATLAIAAASTLAWFVAAWGLAGVAMAAVLYPPAFAALTRWYGPRRVRALTILTLAAGLASTTFAPLTAALAARLDWRATYLVLAGVLAVVTIPAHALLLRPPWPHQARARDDHPAAVAAASTARSRPFLALAAANALGAFALFAVVVNLVPLLVERGLSSRTAAWALGLGGVGQVMGRLGFGALVRRSSVRGRTLGVLLAAAGSTLLLGSLPGPALVLVAAAVLAGMSRGMFTLLQATAVSDRWGTRSFGRLNGLLSAPATAAMAIAPWAGATIAAQLGGYPQLFTALTAIAAAGAVISLWGTPVGSPESTEFTTG